jgi:long-chain acyl-CoA synthetase
MPCRPNIAITDVKAMVLKSTTATARAAKLAGFEIAKAVHLIPEPFSVDNDLLTPTFKLKRHHAKKYFKTEIANMYKGLEGK